MVNVISQRIKNNLSFSVSVDKICHDKTIIRLCGYRSVKLSCLFSATSTGISIAVLAFLESGLVLVVSH